ncbi:MAG: uroporphyrinogen-III synthase [Magnetococcales bacterium]|nr:uroporphyrinogen-III synthase [Magnetococcales bacterium]
MIRRCILVTRPEPGASETARLIESHGHEALLAPVMTIAPMADPHPFQQAIQTLDRYDGVILTSANAARAFVTALPTGVIPPPLFAVGNKTGSILTRPGWQVSIPEQPQGGETLGETVLRACGQGKRFLFPRAEEGREELITLLEKAGKTVETMPVYRSVPVDGLPKEVVRRLPELDALLFFSPRTVEVFLDLLCREDNRLPDQAVIVAISPLTAGTLTKSGVRVDLTAPRPDGESLLQALEEYWQNRNETL